MSKPKHVLIIVQNLPVPFDRRVWQEANSLFRSGYAVSVICPTKKIYPAGWENLDGIDIYRYSMLYDADRAAFGFFVEFIFCWLATLWIAVKICLKKPFQLIHACNPPDTYFALAFLFRAFGVKFIFDHHDLLPEMYVAKGNPRSGALYRGLIWLERWTLRSADAVIAVNESHRDIAVRRADIPVQKITIVRSGPRRVWADLSLTNPELKRGKRFLVVFLGEMGSQDGVDRLLHSIKLYTEMFPAEVLFALIGGGPEQVRMRQLAHDSGLDEWVEFTGRVTDDKLLRQYLATADLCIAPDPLTEYGDLSTTNKMIEYLAFGKAVVAFALTEHRRTAGDAAEYVKPNDDLALTTATHNLLMDEGTRLAMGTRGRERFLSVLAWDIAEEKLLGLYSKVLDSR